MKRVVVYQSSTGFTKQYAQWIAKALECESVDLKKIAETELKDYDQVIYGGWIMGNMIVGWDKVSKMNVKQLVLFAVGSSPATEETKEMIQTTSKTGELPLFYFEGGFHFEQLKLPIRLMLKGLKKSVTKKENKTPQDEYMAQVLGTSFDHSSEESIAPLVAFCQQA